MTEDGLLESLQEMDFSGTYCLLTSDGIDELPEQWLVDCSQDIEPCLPAEEMYVFHSNIHNHLDL
jgi:hypothetical protein